jgi:hypothetical protein
MTHHRLLLPSAAIVAVTAAALLLSGCSAGPATSPTADAGIGAWPTFLPSPTAGSIARGDATTPALSYAGSPVLVTTDAGRMRVDVQGPAIPDDTTLDAPVVDATFTVTVSQASHSIPLTAGMFDVYDNAGATHALTPTEPLPAEIAPGESQVIHLRGTLPAGEGMLRLLTGGTSTVAAWDFVIEDD